MKSTETSGNSSGVARLRWKLIAWGAALVIIVGLVGYSMRVRIESRTGLPSAKIAVDSWTARGQGVQARPNDQNAKAPASGGPLAPSHSQFKNRSAVAYGPTKHPAIMLKSLLTVMRLSGDPNDKVLAPLLKDIIYGRVGAVVKALDEGSSSQNFTIKTAGPGQGGAKTLLDIAIDAGQRGVIKAMLQHGAGVEPASSDSPGPLVEAADLGEDDVVKELLRYGADVNQKSWDGSTPLVRAIYAKNVTTVHLLIENGANVEEAMNYREPDGVSMKVSLRARSSGPAGRAIREILVAHGVNLPPKK